MKASPQSFEISPARDAALFLELYDSMAELVRRVPLLCSTVLGLGAWVAEWIGVYLLCIGPGEAAAG